MTRRSLLGVVAGVGLVSTIGFAATSGRPGVHKSVTTSRAGEVVEDLDIVTEDGPGLVVRHNDITMRRCRIRHAAESGIEASRVSGLIIEDCEIIHTGASSAGPNPDSGRYNIYLYKCPGAVVQRVRLEKGSSGVRVSKSESVALLNIEGHDFRGPFPRGQLVQFSDSPHGILADFSCECDDQRSWPEDNVSIWRSEGVTVQRGLVDGNNAPSGFGIMVEESAGCLVENVDAVRQMNGCFGSAGPGARDNVFRRCRARDNRDTDQGRGKPRSKGLVFGSAFGAKATSFEDCVYWNIANPSNLSYDNASMTVRDFRELAFIAREPVRIELPWSSAD